MPYSSLTDLQRFLQYVHKTETCWLWTASRDKDSYGGFALNGKTIGAHVAAYILLIGQVPLGLGVCHTCDNPPCVNPDHLFLGDQKANMSDCSRKGRCNNGGTKGEANGRVKLTKELVVFIRSSQENHTELGRMLDVSGSLIAQIRARKLWSHV
jgi:hypothetical protein